MISKPVAQVLRASLRTRPNTSLPAIPFRELTSAAPRIAKESKKALRFAPSLSNASSSRASSALLRSKYNAVAIRTFSTTQDKKAKNRIYTSVRRPDEFLSYVQSSTSSRTPLITLWTASYCPSCRAISPLLNSLIANGIGESSSSSVNYCEVEFDSKDIMESGLGMDYMITSLPTLMTFDRGEVMMDSKVVDVAKMKDEAWLTEWIETESRRKGEGTGGGDIGSGLFGGLFGNTRQ